MVGSSHSLQEIDRSAASVIAVYNRREVSMHTSHQIMLGYTRTLSINIHSQNA
ncbi:hypothetical protein CY34DRAFT_812303 [Suillus luteus UH-Slu-Lm8-n1]|uniref:Uncharacterized protein n=1 Tax=Suillus luteus UH-Slu-Lm8-n1 TaxID=930992 RepID=A0A0C9ZCI1_9AGAM|nr:hypothetical protein CY34DRAFT_812303 [Suillus luteus UH-Slu-Lm8-n1]